MPDIAFSDHFFRHQSARMVSILSRTYGLQYLELIEDCVQDALIDAVESWPLQGAPRNPGGWLYDVARKKLINQLNRKQKWEKKIAPNFYSQTSQQSDMKILKDDVIQDAQLEMLFACCHPQLQKEAQLAMALKTLCGFGISEIASALLTSKETINKQLYRSKKQFREGKIRLGLPGKTGLAARVEMVLKIMYLMFNEGYFSAGSEMTLSKDLCFESIRLTQELEQAFPKNSQVKALLAIMFFQFARFPSRVSASGELVLFHQQNRANWNFQMINQGIAYLQQSQGNELSMYHLLAGILLEYLMAAGHEKVNQKQVLHYYELLSEVKYDEVVSFNHAVAMYESGQVQPALDQLLKLVESVKMKRNWLLYFTIGEIFFREGRQAEAGKFFAFCRNLNYPVAFHSKIVARLKALD